MIKAAQIEVKSGRVEAPAAGDADAAGRERVLCWEHGRGVALAVVRRHPKAGAYTRSRESST